jgi:hypothetical protein
MAAVNPVKVANGQRAGLSQCWVLMAAKDFHATDYRFLVARFSRREGLKQSLAENCHEITVYYWTAGRR